MDPNETPPCMVAKQRALLLLRATALGRDVLAVSSDMLRRAATLMRERAQAATPGPWEALTEAFTISINRIGEDDDDLGDEVIASVDEPDADHVASWHPAVALAVADLLDIEAVGVESGNWRPCVDSALAVARAYLGEPDG